MEYLQALVQNNKLIRDCPLDMGQVYASQWLRIVENLTLFQRGIPVNLRRTG